MEMYIEQGSTRMDCELKIMEKYKRNFHIMRERKIRMGGFMGFFSRPGVEVEFYFSPILNKNPMWQGYSTGAPISWQTADIQKQYYADQIARNASTLEDEKRKVIASAGKSYEQTIAAGRETSQQIIDSLNEIKEKIDLPRKEEHPAFAQAVRLLKLNDFSQNYIDRMLERMRKELPIETLENPDAVAEKLLEWIGESVSIYKEDERQRKPKIMVLVGPTGVGKTTTIAKLAAIFGVGNSEVPAVNVRMITIDAFRIGAKAQLEAYGNIMEIPVSYIDNKQDLRKEIALHSEETDLFLIDTIGKSPKELAELGEMKEILDGCGRGAQTHLVFSASTKTSDIEDILRQFEPFNYRSVVITKMDETNHIGNVISALAEKKKPVSYITDGQKVHKHIKKATTVNFLINLEDFKVDREKIENRFPQGEVASNEADQFKWS